MRNDERRRSMELLFISFVGIVALSALVTALGYDLVSARAPLCILVPLIILIGVQFNRARKAARSTSIAAELGPVVRGMDGNFNSVLTLIGWMTLFLVMIYGIGHYAGMVVFMLILLRIVARERWLLSLAVTAGVTATIYVLFEHVFRIELYRGLVLDRLLA